MQQFQRQALSKVQEYIKPACDHIRCMIVKDNIRAIYNQPQLLMGSGLPDYKSFRSIPQPSTNFKTVLQIQSKHIHNRYCNYILLNRQKSFQNELVSWFPVLKNNTNEQLLNVIQQKIDNDCQIVKDMKKWRNLLDQYLLGLDLQQCFIMLMFFQHVGLNQTSMKNICYRMKVPPKPKQLIMYSLQKVRQYSTIQDIAKVKGHLQVTIQPGQKISQYSVPNTGKFMFCPACWIYDCKVHKNPTQNNFCRFTHYKNTKMSFTDIQPLVKAKYDILNKRIPMGQHCSKNCFLSMSSQKYLKLRDYQLVNPVIRALIRMGVQTFGYMPCLIWNLVGKYFNCQKVFVFMMQQMQIQNYPKLMYNQTQYEMLQRLPIATDNPKIVKKKMDKKLKYSDNRYPYCLHYFIDRQPNLRSCTQCVCNQRGFCIPICSCPPQCKLMNIGCKCVQQSCKTQECRCFAAQLQCDPQICNCCFTTYGRKKINNCRNNQIQLNIQSRVFAGQSSFIAGGLGCFAGQKIFQNTLIGRYTGQIIEQQDFIRQQIAQQKDITFYTYGFKDSTKYSIDAKYFGNKTRYINHSKKYENSKSKNNFSLCEYFMGIYANRDIQQNQQLYLNYDVDGHLQKRFKFDWINK